LGVEDIMLRIRTAQVPSNSLLSQYAAAGAYADCYVTELPGSVSHAQFVEAFYTTALFKLERLLLGLFVSLPSTDIQAKQLAEGQGQSFAAWSVEARAHDELLLSAGRTKSWLMVGTPIDSQCGTRLFFGSAITRGSRGDLGPLFNALLGFHKLYSRALLLSATTRLSRQVSRGSHVRRGDA
jgi:hypothetical protein